MTSDFTRSLLKGYVDEGLGLWKDNDAIVGLDGSGELFLEQGSDEILVYVNGDYVDSISYFAPDLPSRLAIYAGDALNF